MRVRACMTHQHKWLVSVLRMGPHVRRARALGESTVHERTVRECGVWRFERRQGLFDLPGPTWAARVLVGTVVTVILLLTAGVSELGAWVVECVRCVGRLL